MVMHFPVHIPFVQALGFELHAFADGQAELQVAVTPEQLNGWAVAHGGLLMTLLDVAMAHAARSVDASGPGVVTIEMKTSFMRPAEGRVRGVGKLLQRTRTLAFCEASALDAQGRLCAHATGTFKYMRALPADGAVRPLNLPSTGDGD